MNTESRRPPFEVRNSRIHGKGAFALRRIRKGTRIIEYTGERIPDEEAERRYPDNPQTHYHTFLFSVDENMCLDAGRHGNEARFINHSCDPNCEALEDDSHIFIYALRNLQPGVELTYDYHMAGKRPRSKADRERYACHCGAPHCRGTMFDLKSRDRPKH